MSLSKHIVFFLLCCSLFIAQVIKVNAAPIQNPNKQPESTQEQSTMDSNEKNTINCNFFIETKTDFALSSDDVFSVTVKEKESGVERTLRINGKDSSTATYILPIGSYTVVDISYKGVNSSIIQEGYGITKDFSLTNEHITRLSLCIGSSQLSLAHDPLLSITQPYLTEDTVKDTSQNENTGDNTTETKKIEDPSEEDVVEYPKEKQTERKKTIDASYYIKKFIFSFIVLTFVGIASFILYKKRT